MTNVKTLNESTTFNEFSVEEMSDVLKGIADTTTNTADVKTIFTPYVSVIIISQRDGDSELTFRVDEKSNGGCILNMDLESSNPEVISFIKEAIWDRCFKDEETFILFVKQEMAKLA